jgi:hypothetical protein
MTQPTREQVRKMADEMSKRLADEGRLIEAGWTIMRKMIPPTASEEQIRDMRIAYMCGAQHLFSCIIGILDPGSEVTASDMRRMDLINNELASFEKEMALRYGKPEGHA